MFFKYLDFYVFLASLAVQINRNLPLQLSALVRLIAFLSALLANSSCFLHQQLCIEELALLSVVFYELNVELQRAVNAVLQRFGCAVVAFLEVDLEFTRGTLSQCCLCRVVFFDVVVDAVGWDFLTAKLTSYINGFCLLEVVICTLMLVKLYKTALDVNKVSFLLAIWTNLFYLE